MFNIKIDSLEDLNYILVKLAEHPFKEVHALLSSIQKQGIEQATAISKAQAGVAGAAVESNAQSAELAK